MSRYPLLDGRPNPCARWEFDDDRFSLPRWVASDHPGKLETVGDIERRRLFLVIEAPNGHQAVYMLDMHDLVGNRKWRNRIAAVLREGRRFNRNTIWSTP